MIGEIAAGATGGKMVGLHSPLSRLRWCLRFLLIFGVVLSSHSWVAADVAIWTGAGGDSNMSNPANWQGNVAPSPGDFLSFDELTALNLSGNFAVNNDFPAGTTFSGIEITSTHYHFVMTGNPLVEAASELTSGSGLADLSLQITNPNTGLVTTATGGQINFHAPVIAQNSGGMTFSTASAAGIETSGSAMPTVGVFSLSAANSWTGTTNVPNAQLNLDFSQPESPTSNILPSGAAVTLGGASLTTTAGPGILNVLGGLAGATNSQTIGLLTDGAGANQINVTAGSAASTTLNIGSLSHSVGGTLRFSTDTVGKIFFNTPPTLTNGIMGGAFTYGNNWATVDVNGFLAAYINYLNESGNGSAISYPASANLKVTGNPAGAAWGLSSNAFSTILDASTGTGQQAFTNIATTITVANGGGFWCLDSTANHQALFQLGTLTGPAGAANQIILNVGEASGTYGAINLVTKSAIADPSGGTETVVKTGPGTWQAFNACTYSGETIINQGCGEITNSSTAMGTGSINVLPGGQFWDNLSLYTNPLFPAGNGSEDALGHSYGAIKLSNGLTLSSNITLTGAARISSTGSSGTLAGTITGPYALWVGTGWSNTGISLSNTANAWTGGLFLDGGTMLTLNNNNVLPNGTNFGDVTLNGVSGLNNTILNTNHYNEIFGGLDSIGEADRAAIESILGGSTSTVTVGCDNADGNFAGNILDYNSPTAGIGRIALVKIGTGTQILSGTNTWSAGTTVTGGVLQFASAGALPASAAITVNTGATVKFTTNPTYAIASMDVEGTAMVDCASGVTAFCQTVTGGGICEKTDAGTFCVTSQNTCTGGVNIQGGTYCGTDDSCLGAIGVVCTVDNATCQITSTCTSSRNFVCEGNATMMCEDQSSNPCTVTCTGQISGPGTLVCTGGDLQCSQSIDPFGLDVIDHEFQLLDNAGTSNVDQLQIGPPSGGSIVGGNSKPAASIPATVSAPATLDLGNNELLIHYSGASPIATIAGYLVSGYAGGTWTGPGIDSSAAAANASYGLGYADSADPGNPAGLAPGTIEVKYTLLGDANLDGTVNGVDFGILAANFNKGVNSWDQGDFNYDNAVNGVDFGYLAANFNKGSSGGSALSDPALVAFAQANGLMADVPEPTCAALAGITGIVLLRRRRGRRQG
jgi:autotransporter-associated beta strand protein